MTNVKLVEQKYTYSFTTDSLFFFQRTFEKTDKKGFFFYENLAAESVKERKRGYPY